MWALPLDAVAVYVHRDNPIGRLYIDQLADIYGEGGSIERWSQLGIRNDHCRREVLVRSFAKRCWGSIAITRLPQSIRMAKDVVTLLSRTPCAIGYSGMAL